MYTGSWSSKLCHRNLFKGSSHVYSSRLSVSFYGVSVVLCALGLKCCDSMHDKGVHNTMDGRKKD